MGKNVKNVKKCEKSEKIHETFTKIIDNFHNFRAKRRQNNVIKVYAINVSPLIICAANFLVNFKLGQHFKLCQNEKPEQNAC